MAQQGGIDLSQLLGGGRTQTSVFGPSEQFAFPDINYVAGFTMPQIDTTSVTSAIGEYVKRVDADREAVAKNVAEVAAQRDKILGMKTHNQYQVKTLERLKDENKLSDESAFGRSVDDFRNPFFMADLQNRVTKTMADPRVYQMVQDQAQADVYATALADEKTAPKNPDLRKMAIAQLQAYNNDEIGEIRGVSLNIGDYQDIDFNKTINDALGTIPENTFTTIRKAIFDENGNLKESAKRPGYIKTIVQQYRLEDALNAAMELTERTPAFQNNIKAQKLDKVVDPKTGETEYDRQKRAIMEAYIQGKLGIEVKEDQFDLAMAKASGKTGDNIDDGSAWFRVAALPEAANKPSLNDKAAFNDKASKALAWGGTENIGAFSEHLASVSAGVLPKITVNAVLQAEAITTNNSIAAGIALSKGATEQISLSTLQSDLARIATQKGFTEFEKFMDESGGALIGRSSPEYLSNILTTLKGNLLKAGIITVDEETGEITGYNQEKADQYIYDRILPDMLSGAYALTNEQKWNYLQNQLVQMQANGFDITKINYGNVKEPVRQMLEGVGITTQSEETSFIRNRRQGQQGAGEVPPPAQGTGVSEGTPVSPEGFTTGGSNNGELTSPTVTPEAQTTPESAPAPAPTTAPTAVDSTTTQQPAQQQQAPRSTYLPSSYTPVDSNPEGGYDTYVDPATGDSYLIVTDPEKLPDNAKLVYSTGKETEKSMMLTGNILVPNGMQDGKPSFVVYNQSEHTPIPTAYKPILEQYKNAGWDVDKSGAFPKFKLVDDFVPNKTTSVGVVVPGGEYINLPFETKVESIKFDATKGVFTTILSVPDKPGQYIRLENVGAHAALSPGDFIEPNAGLIWANPSEKEYGNKAYIKVGVVQKGSDGNMYYVDPKRHGFFSQGGMKFADNREHMGRFSQTTRNLIRSRQDLFDGLTITSQMHGKDREALRANKKAGNETRFDIRYKPGERDAQKLVDYMKTPEGFVWMFRNNYEAFHEKKGSAGKGSAVSGNNPLFANYGNPKATGEHLHFQPIVGINQSYINKFDKALAQVEPNYKTAYAPSARSFIDPVTNQAMDAFARVEQRKSTDPAAAKLGAGYFSVGGSGNKYYGRYQVGLDAHAERIAKIFKIKPVGKTEGYSNKKLVMEVFRRSPEMQDAYMSILLKDYDKFLNDYPIAFDRRIEMEAQKMVQSVLKLDYVPEISEEAFKTALKYYIHHQGRGNVKDMLARDSEGMWSFAPSNSPFSAYNKHNPMQKFIRENASMFSKRAQ